MHKKERVRLIYLILNNIAGFLFATPGPLEPLHLGKDHTLRSEKLNSKREQLFNEICAQLASYSDDELLQSFTEMGRPQTPWSESWASANKLEIKQSFSEESEWHLIELFRSKDLADFIHWGRSEFLSVDEITWLSVGLEPREKFIRFAKPSKRTDLAPKPDEVIEYMTRHRELIRRKFDPRNFGDHPDLKDVQFWMQQVNLDVHSGFIDMLETRTTNSSEAAQNSEPSKRPHKRELDTVTQLFTVMAMEYYGYRPEDKRSPTPKEIVDAAAARGIEISDDTVRKYLRIGASFLPTEENG